MEKIYHIILVMAMLFCCSTTQTVSAQSQSPETPPTYTPTRRDVPLNRKGSDPSLRPHKPSMQQICCYHENGILYIEFRVPEGTCNLTVTSSEQGVEEYTIESSIPSEIYIGALDEFDIEIETENGNTYEGGIH